MNFSILTIIYIISSVTFILGLKMLSHPETARKGNLVAAGGMFLAIFGTIFLYEDLDSGEKLHNYIWIFSGLVIGGIIGLLAARRVKMTAMPEMVSLFNGMGGACAALISITEFNHFAANDYTFRIYEAYGNTAADAGFLEIPVRAGTMITIFLGLIIGSVSFAGSIIAWGKLAGKIKDYSFRGQHIVNLILLAVAVLLSAYLIYETTQFALAESYDNATSFSMSNGAIHALFYSVFLLALVYGVLFVLPIGGAD